MSYKYVPYTDSFVHIPDEQPIHVVKQTDLTDECINRIADAVVQKLREVEYAGRNE